MRPLANKVAKGLKRYATYTINRHELNRAWPIPLDKQEKEIRAFVEENRWRLLHCTEAVGAIIAKRRLNRL